MRTGLWLIAAFFGLASVTGSASGDDTILALGPEQIVQAGGASLQVPGYSVPSLADWDNDGLSDLVVGEGSSSYPGKVRIYINAGTTGQPQYLDYFYAQSNGSDLACAGSGCMGCFPRVVYWDGDSRKDLLVGESTGKLRLYLNIGTDESPTFDAGAYLQAGPAGSKTDIYVGSRPTPTVVDWDSDGVPDLVVGAVDGLIRIYINVGTAAEPAFEAVAYAQAYGVNLDIGSRSSPQVLDLDADGRKDILTGNTEGQLRFYKNIGTEAAPSFSGSSAVESAGVAIDLPGTPRSRPFVCYWGDDAYLDVLIGAGDGKVHLYEGTPIAGDFNGDGRVDFADFARFSGYWGQSACGECGGADLAADGRVDFADLAELTANWLAGI